MNTSETEARCHKLASTQISEAPTPASHKRNGELLNAIKQIELSGNLRRHTPHEPGLPKHSGRRWLCKIPHPNDIFCLISSAEYNIHVASCNWKEHYWLPGAATRNNIRVANQAEAISLVNHPTHTDHHSLSGSHAGTTLLQCCAIAWDDGTALKQRCPNVFSNGWSLPQTAMRAADQKWTHSLHCNLNSRI